MAYLKARIIIHIGDTCPQTRVAQLEAVLFLSRLQTVKKRREVCVHTWFSFLFYFSQNEIPLESTLKQACNYMARKVTHRLRYWNDFILSVIAQLPNKPPHCFGCLITDVRLQSSKPAN